MARVNWTNQAIDALAGIYEYLQREAPNYADEIVQQLFAVVDRLEDHPLSGRKVPEADREDIREIISGHFRIIHWVIDQDHIDILSVVHDSRDMDHPYNQPWNAH